MRLEARHDSMEALLDVLDAFERSITRTENQINDMKKRFQIVGERYRSLSNAREKSYEVTRSFYKRDDLPAPLDPRAVYNEAMTYVRSLNSEMAFFIHNIPSDTNNVINCYKKKLGTLQVVDQELGDKMSLEGKRGFFVAILKAVKQEGSYLWKNHRGSQQDRIIALMGLQKEYVKKIADIDAKIVKKNNEES